MADSDHNVTESSTVANTIARDISQVHQGAEDIKTSSEDVLAKANHLFQLAETLKELMARFSV
ncbi:MAG TPA: hypothetical protein VK564_09570 [Thermodesulfobacteriota bacterium]|nr:hypothetical protein [Thermodesulfobacteriota bacterium]